MSEFLVRVETDLTPAQAWERVWDLDRQRALVPLTRVDLDPPATRLGDRAGFTGRTSFGPVGFEDPMRITTWSPPTDAEGGTASVVKVGRVVGGRIEVRVDPLRGGAVVRWREELTLPWLPAPARPLEAVAARMAAPGYRWVLRRLVAAATGASGEGVGMALRIEIFPADIEASLRFYSALGFEVLSRTDDPPYAWIGRDAVRIGMLESPARPAEHRHLPSGTEIVLDVDDVRPERDRVLAAGIEPVEDLTEREWHLTDFRVHDPDGYYLRITGRSRR